MTKLNLRTQFVTGAVREAFLATEKIKFQIGTAKQAVVEREHALSKFTHLHLVHEHFCA
jgi:hypothetical protein